MTAQSDPYVRVYYRIIDDAKFADVYDDKATLGWWLTLLLAADATHPAPANLPRRLPKKVMETLVGVGLIDCIGTDRYRVHGLAAEREHRSDHARRAAQAKHEQPVSSPRAAREHPVSTAHGLQYPNRTEPNLSEPSRATPGLRSIGELLRKMP